MKKYFSKVVIIICITCLFLSTMYIMRNFLKDKKIRVNIGDKIFEGIAKSIVEDGRLEIEMNGEIKLFSVGEIKIEKGYY